MIAICLKKSFFFFAEQTFYSVCLLSDYILKILHFIIVNS